MPAARDSWHPRGEVQWTTWRDAVPGETRVEHVRSGAQGTFVRWPTTRKGRNPGYAVIRWDHHPHDDVVGRVVAYAFDLREIA